MGSFIGFAKCCKKRRHRGDAAWLILCRSKAAALESTKRISIITHCNKLLRTVSQHRWGYLLRPAHHRRPGAGIGVGQRGERRKLLPTVVRLIPQCIIMLKYSDLIPILVLQNAKMNRGS